jgi:hypothetical protein
LFDFRLLQQDRGKADHVLLGAGSTRRERPPRDFGGASTRRELRGRSWS